MLTSFAEAAAILDRRDYANVARRNARFVLDNLQTNGLLLRTYKDGQAKLNAYLEDYAFFVEALLALYETTGELEWFEAANGLAAKMIDEFWDEENGGFFYTGNSHEDLIIRSKDYYDNATPSGNSVAAIVLLRLAVLTENEDYRRRAVTILRLLAEPIKRHAAGFGRALAALDFYLSSPKEIAIVGDPDSQETRLLTRQVWDTYIPNKVVAHSPSENSDAARRLALLRERPMVDSQPTAYVCQNYVCQEPVTEPSSLKNQLLRRA
jgi:uncharacterized protein YyaL (SSP411 family)